MSKTYRINECFLSLQGEGVRAGTVNMFVRFSGCNLQCSVEPGPKSPGGFDCDTEFASGRTLTLDEIARWCGEACMISGLELPTGDGGLRATPVWPTPWLILTGGEPGLQVDAEFCDYFHARGCKLAIETNGTIDLPKRLKYDNSGEEMEVLDWITLSPKVAEHAVKQLWANEVRYVRGFGQGIPKPTAKADHYCLSPAFDGGIIHPKTMQWCMQLTLQNPIWRLSCQQHKWWNVR